MAHSNTPTNTPTIADVIASRTSAGLGDLLLDVYDHAYCAALGLPRAQPTDGALVDLLIMLETRHRVEILQPRGWVDPPPTVEELPGWLPRQPQQADAPQLRAAIERQRALGDAQPPEELKTNR